MMEEELDELRFKDKGEYYELWLNNFKYSIRITKHNNIVFLSQDDDLIELFEYRQIKLVNLINSIK